MHTCLHLCCLPNLNFDLVNSLLTPSIFLVHPIRSMAWKGSLTRCIRELRFHLNPISPQAQGIRYVLPGSILHVCILSFRVTFVLINSAPVTCLPRSWIENEHRFVKSINPTLPMLVRETDDPDFVPLLIALYDYGEDAHAEVPNMTHAQVTGLFSAKKFRWPVVCQRCDA